MRPSVSLDLAGPGPALAILSLAALAGFLAWRVARLRCGGRPRPLWLALGSPARWMAGALGFLGFALVCDGLQRLLPDVPYGPWLRGGALAAAFGVPAALAMACRTRPTAAARWRRRLDACALALGACVAAAGLAGALCLELGSGAPGASRAPALGLPLASSWIDLYLLHSLLFGAAALGLTARSYTRRWMGRGVEVAALGFAAWAPAGAALAFQGLASGSTWDGAVLGLVAAGAGLAAILEADRMRVLRNVAIFGLDLLVVDDQDRVLEVTEGARHLLGAPLLRRGSAVSMPELEGVLRGKDAGWAQMSVSVGPEGTRNLELEIRELRRLRACPRARAIVVRERTQEIAVTQELRRLALYDSLTGLANRRRFLERLAEAIHAARLEQSQVAVLYTDLDGFKKINDSAGHAAGDETLRLVAQRLRQQVQGIQLASGPATRPCAEVARLGGDEFAILLTGLASPESVGEFAERVVALMSEPLWIGQQHVVVSTSMGISVFPRDGDDLETLLQRADSALYHAKRRGRNSVEFFRASLGEATQRRVSVVQGLERAIETEELELYYQPKVALQTNEVVGAEALLRWTNQNLGRVGPAEFIPLAEGAHLIGAIGTWVIEETCRQIAAWQEAGFGVVPVAVNVSGHQLANESFPSIVAEALKSHGVAPKLMEIELTESAFLEDREGAARCLSEVRAMGVRVALDDFGTGYSALGYLPRIPLDSLKLDRSFVRDIDADPSAVGITRAIISMARTMNLRLIAEGLDSRDHVEVLKDLGCDEAQGFVFSPALPAREFCRFLARGEAARQGQRMRIVPGGVAHKAAEGAAADPDLPSEPTVDLPARPGTTGPPDSPVVRSAAPELPAARAHLRYVLVLDDATQSLASVALDLSRLGILPLYTPFPDESKLLAAQERGRIGALMVSPEVSPGDVQSLVRYVDTLQESASPALIVVGEEPGEDRREELRRLGASWALWKPYADGQLRFVLNAAMGSPSSQTARSEPRAPTELRVSVAGAGGSSVASILTVSAGGAFIEMDAPPALGTRLRICFEIDGEPLDVSARVVYSNLRERLWSTASPRGIGVAFEAMDAEDQQRLRDFVKAELRRYAT